jgi:hypothetical protein
MNATDVTAVLQEFPVRFEAGPHGFTFKTVGVIYSRVERTSGIGGLNGWHIVTKPYDADLIATASVSTKAGFRRLMREWMTTDPKPSPQLGYITFARLNKNQYGEAWVWVQRRLTHSRTNHPS